MKQLVDEVRGALLSAGIRPGLLVLAAVSGGPDSTALVRALGSLREGLGFRLAACIVDHGIRPSQSAAADVAFVRGLCAELKVPLMEKAVPAGDCARRAREHGESLEAAARDLRYSLLRAAGTEAGAWAIALGHTRDDVIETLLMRVLQGSDVHGLAGIAPRRGPLIRPLLACTRAQVLSYLRALGQEWREDESNRDETFLRNRVRHRLIPVLEEHFPGFAAGLLLLSRKLALSGDLVRRLARGMPWREEGSGFSIDAAEFFSLHPAVRSWSLLEQYDRFRPAAGPRRLPWRSLSSARREGPPASDGTLFRGAGARLSLRAGRLWWGADIASPRKKGYFMVVSAARSAEIREAEARVSISRGVDPSREAVGGLAFSSGRMRPPFVLRSKRKGDFIRLAAGTTSVKELLIEMRVPEAERDRIPILADRSGVLAVLGGARDYRNRARTDVNPEGDAADRIAILIDKGMVEGREQQR